MTEWANRQPESADDWSSFVAEYTHTCEFGDSKFQAINDFHNLQRLYRQAHQDNLVGTDTVNGKSMLTPEERRDLSLKRIVLLEHTIEQKAGSLVGYEATYMQIRDGFDSMLFEASKEAKTNFPDDEPKQTEYVQKLFDETLGYLSMSIVEKENIDLKG